MFQRSRQRLSAVLAALALTATLAACGSSGSSGTPDTMKVVITTPAWSSEHGVFVLADELGFLDDEGVDVEFSLAKSGTETIQQVIGGDAQIGVATLEPVMIAHERQTDLKLFMPYYRDFIYGLVSLQGDAISTVEDLRGKRIGIVNAQSTGATIVRTALEEAGMSENDVTFVPIGVGAQQVSAIESGEVDVLAMWDTIYTNLESRGIELTPISVPSIEGLFGGGLIAPADALDENPEPYEKVGRAVAKAFAWARLHPEDAVEMMWNALPEIQPGANQDRGQALADQVAYMETRIAPLIPDPASSDWISIDEQPVQKYIQWAVDAGLISEPFDVDQIVDETLSDAIGDFDPETLQPSQS